MFVMINTSGSPWMALLILLVQVLVSVMQSNREDEQDEAVLVAILLVILLIVVIAFKYYGLIRTLFRMRGQYPDLSWLAYFREGLAREGRRQEAAAPAAAYAATTHPSSSEECYNRAMRTIQSMPMEEFKSPDDLRKTSIHDLKERLKRREVNYSSCVERNELVSLLASFRGGPSNNDTCAICCEEYITGDILRLLRRCKHEFHLECLDKWAFTSVNADRKPACPLCNQSLD